MEINLFLLVYINVIYRKQTDYNIYHTRIILAFIVGKHKILRSIHFFSRYKLITLPLCLRILRNNRRVHYKYQLL